MKGPSEPGDASTGEIPGDSATEDPHDKASGLQALRAKDGGRQARERMMLGGHSTEADLYQALGLVTQLGLVVAAAVVAGLLAGHYLDKLLGAGGVITATGVVLGVAGGFVGASKLLFRDLDKDGKLNGGNLGVDPADGAED